MSAPRRPFDRFVDLTVYAPIGLAVEMSRCLPKLISAGRARAEQRLAVARTVGEMVVKVGAGKVREQLAERRAEPPRSAAAAPATPLAPSLRVVDEAVDDARVDELPIDEYESLAASQVVARLGSLEVEELALVEQFERAHRQRRTVLGKIEQLQRA